MNSARSNQVRTWRIARAWSQAELAEKSGISRTAISAIEGQRLVPSVAAAMSLAKVFGASVEALFGPVDAPPSAVWASESGIGEGPYWEAEIAGRLVRYPAKSIPMLTPLPDGNAASSVENVAPCSLSPETLVLACCDPAAGLLASLFAKATGMRLLVLQRSSSQALELLREGLIHMAGVHLSTADEPNENARVVQEKLGAGYQLIRMAQWEEGIAVSPALKLKSVRAAVRSKLTWIGREPGSGARRCLDRLLADRAVPRRLARHHRGVAEAVQSGWADAGVCVRLSSAEAGLDFLPVQREAYDVCCSSALLDQRQAQAFLRVVRSAAYKAQLAELPGYTSSETGNLWSVN